MIGTLTVQKLKSSLERTLPKPKKVTTKSKLRQLPFLRKSFLTPTSRSLNRGLTLIGKRVKPHLETYVTSGTEKVTYGTLTTHKSPTLIVFTVTPSNTNIGPNFSEDRQAEHFNLLPRIWR